MSHRNARTTVYARRLIVERHQAGWPQARIAEQLGVSRATVSKWWARYLAEGWSGLEDRSSRPRTCPTRTDPAVEAAILALRETERRGAVYLAGELGLVASTVGRFLARHQVPHLAAIDPITGAEVRRRHSGVRYERRAPGDLLHIDVKKLGRVPAGGGWRLHGRIATSPQRHKRTPIGYDYLHVAIDDHSRVAYIEALPDERDATCAGFLHRAVAWFRGHGVRVLRILTDNAKVYRVGQNWRAVCVGLGIRRRFTGPVVAERGVANRCELVKGSFFESIPAGGNAYIMRWIIHDWNDDDATKILRNVRAVIPPDGRLTVFDRVLPERITAGDVALQFGTLTDLNMLVNVTGLERTEDQFRKLFAAGGFRLTSARTTPSGLGIVEGAPA